MSVPVPFSTLPLKRLISTIASGVSVNATDSPAEKGNLGVLKTSCVYTGVFDSSENKTVVPEDVDRVACPVRAGTLVVSRMNTPDLVGAAGLATVDEPDIYLPDRLWQVSFHQSLANPRYVYWWTRSALYRDQVKVACAGTSSSMQNLDQDSFRSFVVPCLTVSEQLLIACFLDDKAARIDALIAEKERLLTAVTEYEACEISRLLLEGLNGAETRDTGKPFVTEVPAHWRTVALKRALLGMGQGWSPQCENQPAEEGEWGVLKVGCVNGTRFDASENKVLPPELQPNLSCVVRKGDVLVSRANTRELVGMAALVEEEHPRLMLCDKLYRLNLHPGWLRPDFAVLLLRSDTSRRQIELGASGASSSMQNISQDVLRELIVALPPVDEQRGIVVAAYGVRESCAALRAHVLQHIARLREYRSSLISAAVTGQLDLGADSGRVSEPQVRALSA